MQPSVVSLLQGDEKCFTLTNCFRGPLPSQASRSRFAEMRVASRGLPPSGIATAARRNARNNAGRCWSLTTIYWGTSASRANRRSARPTNLFWYSRYLDAADSHRGYGGRSDHWTQIKSSEQNNGPNQ